MDAKWLFGIPFSLPPTDFIPQSIHHIESFTHFMCHIFFIIQFNEFLLLPNAWHADTNNPCKWMHGKLSNVSAVVDNGTNHVQFVDIRGRKLLS